MKESRRESLLPDPETVVRYHFIGGERLLADINAVKLKEIASLPATAELRTQTLGKLARVPFKRFRPGGDGNTNDFSGLFEPLLADLLHFESFAELRAPTNQSAELTLAVRLFDERAEVWRTNLVAAFATWSGAQPGEVRVGEYKGWEVRRNDAPNLFRVVRAGAWLVAGWGQDRLPLQEEVLQRIKTSARPVAFDPDQWLEAFVNWPRLERWVKLRGPVKLAPMELALSGRGGNLRTTAKLVYPEPLNFSFEQWNVPTNLIRAGVISFTAAQGIAPWLGRHPQVEPFKLASVPNQVYFWALSGTPYQVFMALPITNPASLMETVVPQLVDRFNVPLQKRTLGSLRWTPERSQVVWEGLPFIAPAMEADTNGFLFGSLFPNTPGKSAFPADLQSQLTSRANLLYYDWEITQARLAQTRLLSQLALIIARNTQLEVKSAAQKWLDAVGPRFGGTVTEITMTRTNELSLVRRSDVGLTGIELVVLAAWLESPHFPFGGLEWPAPLYPRQKRPLPPPGP